jgi:antitoxin VapB
MLWYLSLKDQPAMTHIAKLFTNGRSQAVRLPLAYRFDVKEVFIRHDPQTGDVILSRRPATWDGFFEALDGVEVPADFLGTSERDQGRPGRDPFESWKE